MSPADPSQTTALAASEEVETDAAVLAAGETEVRDWGGLFPDKLHRIVNHLPLTVPYRSERLGPERCGSQFPERET